MARLSLYLPPAAGDYSGAASVLFGLDCLVVLVDAGCCTRNYTEYDEPRWSRRRKTAFSAQLRTLEATLGDESRIIEQTCDMARELGVSCIALLGTPVPAVTGMDLAGIACEVEAAAGIPTIGIETSGFETYECGASKALAALVRRFAQEGDGAVGSASEKLGMPDEPLRDWAPRVNILGLSPQDFSCEEDMDTCTRWFEEAGAQVVFVTDSNYTLADVAAAGSADASVVVAWSGLEAARQLEERFGVPYAIGRPWCAEDAKRLTERMRRDSLGDIEANVGNGIAHESASAPADILLIGEQVAMNGLREHVAAAFAAASLPLPRIAVASRFHGNPELARPGDLFDVGESELTAWAGSHAGFLWIGDPLFEALPGFAGRGLVHPPHEATSSALYTREAKQLAGECALEAVRSAIMSMQSTSNS